MDKDKLYNDHNITKIFIFDKNKITIDELLVKIQTVFDYYNTHFFEQDYHKTSRFNSYEFEKHFYQPIQFNYNDYVEFWKNGWSNFQYTKSSIINNDEKLIIFYYLIRHLFYDCNNSVEIEYRRQFEIILNELKYLPRSNSLLKRYFTKTMLNDFELRYDVLTGLIYDLEYDLDQQYIFSDNSEHLILYINEKIFKIVYYIYECLDDTFNSRSEHNIPKWWKYPFKDTLKPIEELENKILLVTKLGHIPTKLINVFNTHFGDFKCILYDKGKDDVYYHPKYIEYVNWN